MKQGYFNTADSAHLYYEVRGSGRPLVLVHGWQCSHLFWQRNVDELAKDFTVVTLDLRGHGNSSKGLHGITIKQFACDVYDLINYLDLKEWAGPWAGRFCCRTSISSVRNKSKASA